MILVTDFVREDGDADCVLKAVSLAKASLNAIASLNVLKVWLNIVYWTNVLEIVRCREVHSVCGAVQSQNIVLR